MINKRGQIEFEPAGILGAVLGAGIMYYMMSTTDVGFFFKLLAIPLGGVAGYFVVAKILGG